jgi:hypothetical protein
LPIPGYYVADIPQSRLLIPEFRKQIESDPRIDRIVIAALWPEYFKETKSRNAIDGIPANQPKALLQSLDNLGLIIQELQNIGKEVTIVLSAPYGEKLSPSQFYERSFDGISYKNPEGMKVTEFLAGNFDVLKRIAKVARFNKANLIDPLDYLSTHGTCIITDEKGIPIRYDLAHLRPGYVREHVKYLDSTVEP